MKDIREFIRDEIEKIVFYPIKDEQSIMQEKLLDSITLVDLAVAIEEKTGITIPTNDLKEENFENINRIVAYLEIKQQA